MGVRIKNLAKDTFLFSKKSYQKLEHIILRISRRPRKRIYLIPPHNQTMVQKNQLAFT